MKKSRIILLLVLAVVLGGGGYGVYMFYKPHRDVTTEKGIEVTAQQIFTEYNTDEDAANGKYLNKAIQVTGQVQEVKKNQTGKTVVYLKTDDPIFGVNCSFKEEPGNVQPGNTITFKGICTGYTSDVVINEGVLIK